MTDLNCTQCYGRRWHFIWCPTLGSPQPSRPLAEYVAAIVAGVGTLYTEEQAINAIEQHPEVAAAFEATISHQDDTP